MTAIRKATEKDSDTVCDALRRSIIECCVLDHRNDPEILAVWLRNKTPSTFASWMDSATNVIFVAERFESIVGVAMLSDTSVIALCYLVPEALNLYIGKALLNEMEAYARRAETTEMRLNSTQTSLSFYKRNGYVDIGAAQSAFGLNSRKMTKILD